MWNGLRSHCPSATIPSRAPLKRQSISPDSLSETKPNPHRMQVTLQAWTQWREEKLVWTTLLLSINPPHVGISTRRKAPQTQTVVTVGGSLPTNYYQARDHGHNKTSVQTMTKTILSLRVVENNGSTQMATLQHHCPLKCHSMNFPSGPAHTQTTIFSTLEPCDLCWPRPISPNHLSSPWSSPQKPGHVQHIASSLYHQHHRELWCAANSEMKDWQRWSVCQMWRTHRECDPLL